jgi:hypothetical protein
MGLGITITAGGLGGGGGAGVGGGADSAGFSSIESDCAKPGALKLLDSASAKSAQRERALLTIRSHGYHEIDSAKT